MSVRGSQKSNSGEEAVSEEGESDGQAESMIVGLLDGTRLGGYGCTVAMSINQRLTITSAKLFTDLV